MIRRINSLFPFWAIVFSCLAYMKPEFFTPHKESITPLLATIMFFMGITLHLDDFARVLKQPKTIFIAVILKFICMPLAALFISKMLHLSTELLIGMILVGVVSGGTAANVIVYLAKGDVALSITITMMSTLLSVFITPLLTLLYVGQSVPVPAVDMLVSILQIVAIPVIFGVILNYFLHTMIKRYESYFAMLSMITIVFVISIVVALNQNAIASIGFLTIIGIILHNSVGLLSGYVGAKWFGFNHTICKTIAIDVGMQNSGLAVALALKYFTPLSALPGAIFSIWHNISGAIFAGFWSRHKERCETSKS